MTEKDSVHVACGTVKDDNKCDKTGDKLDVCILCHMTEVEELCEEISRLQAELEGKLEIIYHEDTVWNFGYNSGFKRGREDAKLVERSKFRKLLELEDHECEVDTSCTECVENSLKKRLLKECGKA